MKAWPSLRSGVISTHLADEGKGLAAHPLGTVAEPDCQLIDEVQAQVISTTRVQLLEDLYDLRTCGGKKNRGLKKKGDSTRRPSLNKSVLCG